MAPSACKKHPERGEGSLPESALIKKSHSFSQLESCARVGLPRSARNVGWLKVPAAVLCLLLLLLLASCRTPGTTVQIVNQTSGAIRGVEVVYPGGSYGIANLVRGASHAKWIKPTADGPLQVSYQDDAGQTHKTENVVVKRGYAGGLAIVLLPQGKVTVEDHTQGTS
jgi:hypothetical protein